MHAATVTMVVMASTTSGAGAGGGAVLCVEELQQQQQGRQLQYLPPGFRLHPTDEELVLHYLCRKADQSSHQQVLSRLPVIAEIDLYKFDPWDLPGRRPEVIHKIGVKKALVFYKGRSPKGVKTNWIMHEYRLAEGVCGTSSSQAHRKGSLRLDDWVLCQIYKKSTNAQHAGKEQENSSSCVEEVLGSLPEIDDPKLVLSQLGSFDGLIETEDQFMESLLKAENTSKNNYDGFSREAALVEDSTTRDIPLVNNSGSSWKLSGLMAAGAGPHGHDGIGYNFQLNKYYNRQQQLMNFAPVQITVPATSLSLCPEAEISHARHHPMSVVPGTGASISMSLRAADHSFLEEEVQSSFCAGTGRPNFLA